MTAEHWARIAAELAAVLAGVPEELPAQDRANVRSLVDAGEYGIALEILCTQLYEYDILPTREILARIAAVGGELGLEASLWEALGE